MIQKPKGTMDVYGKDGRMFVYLTSLINELCAKYNYKFIKTPMFESSELFHRGIGNSTDVITKETYDFIDRGDRNMTLKPEGTAGVVRSYIENKMYTNETVPTKLYYFSPCFRYERPQAGRLREHTQFGVEVLGSNSPLVDAEVISLAVNLFKLLEFKNIKVKINSLGDNISRETYKKALIDYLKPNIDNLCGDCRDRFEKNPLRILDCKVDNNNDILANVPKLIDYLNDDSIHHFDLVKKYLSSLEIKYEIDDKLVRGLDYYSYTVFEIQADVEGFGSQNTICGGGRYNNLVETIGGPNIPGIGFGMGLERLMLAISKTNTDLIIDNIDLFIINLCDDKSEVFKLANEIRMNGFKVDIDYLDKNIKGQFKQSDYHKAKYVVVIGDDELEKDMIIIKNTETKEEKEIYIGDIVYFLDKELLDE